MSEPKRMQLDPHELIYPENFHTGPNARIVGRLAEGWDPRAAGVITVSRRADGTLIVLDGVQRVLAARQLGININALVYDELTGNEEIMMFVSLNTTRPLS